MFIRDIVDGFTIIILSMVIGFILILLGIVLMVVHSMRYRGEERVKSEMGGVVLIGPLPIVFGTSERIARITILLAIALMALVIIIMFLIPYILSIR